MSSPAEPDRTPSEAPPASTNPAPGPTGPYVGEAGAEAPIASAGRCRLLGEIGRGGMGAVFKAHDPELNRDLAVKVLLERHGGRPELVRRFLEEARVAGRLQHPGVAPVHDVGRLADDRPFFAMKLVEGRTLDDLLRERKSPPEDLPRFLKVFEQVCQTLAYAHAQRIIHRDLKPLNIMVGAFGEVQVMDWGLAKAISSAEPIDAGASPRAAGETRAGQVLGTPAYMAPEQARGETDRLDARCDVFGLGAILCVILTGRPPYSGATGDEVVRQAQRGELAEAFARLEGSGAEAELVGLTKACLAAEPEGRPRDAGAAAEVMAAYLAGVQERLRKAEVERAAAQARAAAERRARWLTVGLAGAVLLLIVGGGGVGLWLRQQQLDRAAAQARVDAEQARAAAERAGAVAADLQQAAEQRKKGRLAEAAAVLERADGRLAGADAPEQRRLVDDERAALDRVRAERALADQLDEVRLAQAAFVGGHFDTASADAGYRAAFTHHNLDVEHLDVEEAAKRIRATAVAERLTAALDNWIAVKRAIGAAGAEHLHAVVERIDDDPWRRRLRAALDAGDRPALQALAAEPQVAVLQPADLVQLGSGLERLKALNAAAAVLAEGRRRNPNDFWLNHQLGRVLLQLGQADEAARYYTAAAALRGDSLGARLNLGVALGAEGRLDEAQEEFRSILAQDRANALARYNLAVALQQQGRLDDAATEYRAVFALTPPMAEAHNNLGVLLEAQKRMDEAGAEYRAALAVDADLAQALGNLGRMLQLQGRLTEGLALLRRGHERQLQEPLWAYPSEKWLRDGERLVTLDAVLPILLRGEAAPVDAEAALSAADLCGRPFKRLYAASARFYADAFAADPALTADPRQDHRYAAACAAAAAGVGQGDDASPTPEERARLRRQALAWLRADLDAWDRGQGVGDSQVRALCRQTLGRWKIDANLAVVRDAGALAGLPLEEQEAWRKLWADVDAVLKKTQAK